MVPYELNARAWDPDPNCGMKKVNEGARIVCSILTVFLTFTLYMAKLSLWTRKVPLRSSFPAAAAESECVIVTEFEV